jgi:dihydrofolate reductase
MANTDSRVTIHMVASLDGFIARKDGRVDWLETSDEFAHGETLDPGFVESFLKTIDCYVIGSRTYETALSFDTKGLGWPYGAKPTFVLTTRDLRRTRDTIHFSRSRKRARPSNAIFATRNDGALQFRPARQRGR